MNITRQSPMIALLTFVVMLGALLFRRQGVEYAPEMVADPLTPFNHWIGMFQQAWPRVAQGLWLVLMSITAVIMTRISLRYKLYGGTTYLPVVLFAVVSGGLYVGHDYLCGAIAALVLARVMHNYCIACRNGYAFTPLFRGSLYLGLLPMIYLPSLPLVVLCLLIPILFKRTFREWLVVLCGLLLPVGWAIYLNWAFTDVALEPFTKAVEGLLAAPCFPLFAGASLPLMLQLFILLASVLCALFFYWGNVYAATSKARALLNAFAWLFVLCLAVVFMPGGSANSLALLAVPASMLIPLVFVRLSPKMANGLYALLLVLFSLHLFW